MGFILSLHGELRWIIAVVAVVALVKFAIGWFSKSSFERFDRILLAATTGLLDLNLLLGLILLVGLGGGFPRHRVEHALTMLVAVLVMHSSVRWRKTGSSAVKFRNGFVTVLVAIILVFVGVTRLRSGWTF